MFYVLTPLAFTLKDGIFCAMMHLPRSVTGTGEQGCRCRLSLPRNPSTSEGHVKSLLYHKELGIEPGHKDRQGRSNLTVFPDSGSISL